jgi:hypothetical protein
MCENSIIKCTKNFKGGEEGWGLINSNRGDEFDQSIICTCKNITTALFI